MNWKQLGSLFSNLRKRRSETLKRKKQAALHLLIAETFQHLIIARPQEVCGWLVRTVDANYGIIRCVVYDDFSSCDVNAVQVEWLDHPQGLEYSILPLDHILKLEPPYEVE